MSKKYFEKLAKNSATSSKEYESEFGLKILQKFGWSKGKGLGANLDGSTKCIQIQRREEGVGLGGEKAKTDGDEKQWDNWWSSAYNSVAGKLGQVGAGTSPEAKTNEGDSSSDSDESSSDREGPVKGVSAIKGARVMRGKLARVCRMDQKPASAGSSTTTGTQDPAVPPAAKEQKASLPNWLVQLRKFRDEQIAKLKSAVGATEQTEKASVAGSTTSEKQAPSATEKQEKKKKKKTSGEASSTTAAPIKDATSTVGQAEVVNTEAQQSEITTKEAKKNKKRKAEVAEELQKPAVTDESNNEGEIVAEPPKKKKKKNKSD
ncbi:unnamed protein product [Amoebophrya sp. A120]|nr:unnamed protein product [Amoebophrya sp. A120]|eukprot:GSA120T00005173001.1